jgi:hypothetical protein
MLLLAPALGILVRGNINTHPVFEELNRSAPACGRGMTPFDGSLVNNASLITDQLSEAELSRFLSEPNRSVDITSAAERLLLVTELPRRLKRHKVAISHIFV